MGAGQGALCAKGSVVVAGSACPMLFWPLVRVLLRVMVRARFGVLKSLWAM